MIPILAAFLIHPMVLTRWQQMLLLLPLCLCVSVVYKAIKCVRPVQLPKAVLASWITIVLGMYAVGMVLYVIYELAT